MTPGLRGVATCSRQWGWGSGRHCSAELFPGDTFVFAAVGLVVAGGRGGRAGSGMRYIPNNRVGIVEKLWSPKGSVPEGRIIALDGRGGVPGRPPPRRPALRPLALAVPDPQGPPGHRPAGQDRLRLRPRRRAAAAEPDARPGRRLQQLPGRPRVPRRASRRPPTRSRAARPARPAAADPPRGRLRDQPRAVRRDHRGRGLSPRAPGPPRAGDARRLAERAEASRRLQPGGHRRRRSRRPTRSTPSSRSRSTASGSSPCRTARRSAPGEIIAPAVGTDRNGQVLPQQLPGPRGVPRRRRPPRPAVRAR